MAKNSTNVDQLTAIAFISDAESKSVVENIPYFELGIEAKVYKGNAQTAYDHLKNKRSPDILIVDLSESKIPLTDIEKIAEVCEPSVEVIAIGKENDVSVFRQLMSVGVRDYVVKPLPHNTLLKCLQTVINEARSDDLTDEAAYAGRIVSFIGARGGVGTSTFAANCAYNMSSEYSKYVGIVDFNFSDAIIANMFNCTSPEKFVEMLKDPSQVDDNLIERLIIEYGDRLGIISTQDEKIEHNSEVTEGLKVLLGLLVKKYNYLFLDFSHTTDPNIQHLALNYSDTAVIMCDLTFASVKGTLSLIEQVRHNSRPDQKIVVLANRIGEYKKGELSKKEFEEAIQYPINYVARFDATHPLEALNSGIPVVNTNGKLAYDIRGFVNQLVGKGEFQKKSMLRRVFAR